MSGSAQNGLGLARIEDELGHRFSDRTLLEAAVTHPSFAEEAGGGADNQRLEFLGDTVVGLVVSRALYVALPDAPEGVLSKLRSRLVSSKVLAELAREQRLGRYLRLGVGEERTDGRKKTRLLADLVESLAGAVYLDGGLEPAEQLLLRWFGGRLQAVDTGDVRRDHKSALQEWSQARYKARPGYELVSVEGPAHEQVFHVRVRVQGDVVASATGGSKKDAEQNAAREAIRALTNPAAGSIEPSTVAPSSPNDPEAP